MQVTVVQSLGPRSVRQWLLDLPEGATVGDALRACADLSLTQALADPGLLGLWGRRCKSDQPLREGDRVEIYRGLRVDPKVARRERFVGQGVRRAGLFARRRPGSKPGY